MGATEVVHGVSASTIGLILGVYQQLVQSLSSFNSEAFVLIRKKSFTSFWNHINGNFLVTILSGIIISLFTSTLLISSIIQKHFIPATSFLFGIIAISGFLLFRKVRKWKIQVGLNFILGVGLSFLLTVIPPVSSPNSLLSTIIGGFLSGFVFIIPGISSAFILLLIGKYQLIVISFNTLDLEVIGAFVFGALIGLWMASRFISKIYIDYHNTTVALLAGLMLGALNKLWPWRQVFEYTTNSKGEQIPAYDTSILPWHYMNITGKDPQIFQAILMIALGVFIVVLIEKIAAGLKTKL